ncbi:MAG: rhodanese-like domain-containing protein [Gammaproteobacteria bacterium]|nr:MAG: rhodanese-like domain-containing protein [Gammaproteobacteria bacterium]
MQFVIKNWYLFIALGVVLYLLVVPMLRQRLAGIRSLNPTEAIQLINRENGMVVDVCEPQEFAAGHVVRALNIPLSNLKARVTELEKYRDRPIILACRSGNRSLKAAFELHRAGFAKVHSLAGGLMAWQNANLPVEK